MKSVYQIYMNHFFLLTILSILLSACSQKFSGGIVNMTVLQAVGPGCQYEVAPAPLYTLDTLDTLRGALGHVVTHPENLENSPDILDFGMGFIPLDLQLAGSGNSFGPLNKSSLLGVSLYHALEKGHFLFKGLDPAADLISLAPQVSNTLIVQDAILSTSIEGKSYADNAAYVQLDSPQGPRDYFFSFPNDSISAIPLGFNAGVMVHEYTHMVAQYLFHNKRSNSGLQTSDQTENVLSAFEEGLADYFGYLATNDPSFFHCSFPGGTDRDLSHPKSLTSQQVQAIQTSNGFDSHEGGAVWASVQYQIGQVIGHTENAKSLIRFLNNLANCTGLSNASSQVTFTALQNCHLQALGGINSSQVQQIYQNAFSAAGGI